MKLSPTLVAFPAEELADLRLKARGAAIKATDGLILIIDLATLPKLGAGRGEHPIEDQADSQNRGKPGSKIEAIYCVTHIFADQAHRQWSDHGADAGDEEDDAFRVQRRIDDGHEQPR